LPAACVLLSVYYVSSGPNDAPYTFSIFVYFVMYSIVEMQFMSNSEHYNEGRFLYMYRQLCALITIVCSEYAVLQNLDVQSCGHEYHIHCEA